ncbi:MAG: hypothetical protein IKX14_00830 [Neisseriaceae bacterium]|nr:hypothetical protein [Neisseriaceae bacterium]
MNALANLYWSLVIKAERSFLKGQYRKDLKTEKTNKTFEEYVVNYYLHDKDIKPTVMAQQVTLLSISQFLWVTTAMSFITLKANEIHAKVDAGEYSMASFLFETLGISGILCLVFSFIFSVFILPHLGRKTLKVYDKKIMQFCRKHQQQGA